MTEETYTYKDLQELNIKTVEKMKYLLMEYLGHLPQKKEYYQKYLENKYFYFKQKGFIEQEDVQQLMSDLSEELNDEYKEKIYITMKELWTNYKTLFNILNGTEIETNLKKAREKFLFNENEEAKIVAGDIKKILDLKKYSEYSAGIISSSVKKYLDSNFNADDFKNKEILKNKLLNIINNKIANTENLSSIDKDEIKNIIANSDIDRIFSFYIVGYDKEKESEFEKEYEKFYNEYIRDYAKPEAEEAFKRESYIAKYLFEQNVASIFNKDIYKTNNINNFDGFYKKYINKNFNNLHTRSSLDELFMTKEKNISGNKESIRQLRLFNEGVDNIMTGRYEDITGEQQRILRDFFSINPGKENNKNNMKKIIEETKTFFKTYPNFKYQNRAKNLINEDEYKITKDDIEKIDENATIKLALKDLGGRGDSNININRIPGLTYSIRVFNECMKTVNVKARAYDTVISNTEQCFDKYIQSVKKEIQNLESLLNGRNANFAFYATPIGSFIMIYYFITLYREHITEKKKMAFLERINTIKQLSKSVKNTKELKGLYKYVDFFTNNKFVVPNKKNEDFNVFISLMIKNISNFYQTEKFASLKEYKDFIKKEIEKDMDVQDLNYNKAFFLKDYLEDIKNAQFFYNKEKNIYSLRKKIDILENQMQNLYGEINVLTNKEPNKENIKKLQDLIEKQNKFQTNYEAILDEIKNGLNFSNKNQKMEYLTGLKNKLTAEKEKLKVKAQNSFEAEDFNTFKDIYLQIQNKQKQIEDINKQIKNNYLDHFKKIDDLISNKKLDNFNYFEKYSDLEKTYNKTAKILFEKEFEKGADKNIIRYKTQTEMLFYQELDLKNKISDLISDIQKAKISGEYLRKKELKLQYYSLAYQNTLSLIEENLKKAKEDFNKRFKIETAFMGDGKPAVKYYEKVLEKNPKTGKEELIEKEITNPEQLKILKSYLTMLNQYKDGGYYNYLRKGNLKDVKKLKDLMNYTYNINDAVFYHLKGFRKFKNYSTFTTIHTDSEPELSKKTKNTINNLIQKTKSAFNRQQKNNKSIDNEIDDVYNEEDTFDVKNQNGEIIAEKQNNKELQEYAVKLAKMNFGFTPAYLKKYRGYGKKI